MKNGIFGLIYVGLFTWPLLILRDRKSAEKSLSAPIKFLYVISFLLLCVGLIFFTHTWFPFWGNILYNLGLGPVTLYDVDTLQLPHSFQFTHSFWILVTFLGILAGLLLFNTILFCVRQFFSSDSKENLWIPFLLISVGFLYFLPLAISRLFDRYIILLIPLALALKSYVIKDVEDKFPNWQLSLGLMFFLIYSYFTVTSTHDYLAWNRARWEALTQLVEKDQIDPKKIDGGFEFNGWFLYDADYKPKEGKSSWWVDDDEYIITMGLVPGYSLWKTYDYPSWVTWGEGHVYILNRQKK